MSELLKRLEADLRIAIKDRNPVRVGVLRMMLARVRDLQVERGRDNALPEEQMVQALSTYAKQRQESALAFADAGREDLRAREEQERDIVLAYLPSQLDDDAVRSILREVVTETGAKTPRDLGQVMKNAMPRLRGQADGDRVQKLARELLAE